MKLTTDIQPRKDGTVKAVVPAHGGAKESVYVFQKDASGVLCCEVENEDHLAYLLDSGNFIPEGDVAADDDDDDSDEGDEGGDGAQGGAAPIEANTPPKPKASKPKPKAEPKPKKSKAAKASE